MRNRQVGSDCSTPSWLLFHHPDNLDSSSRHHLCTQPQLPRGTYSYKMDKLPSAEEMRGTYHHPFINHLHTSIRLPQQVGLETHFTDALFLLLSSLIYLSCSETSAASPLCPQRRTRCVFCIDCDVPAYDDNRDALSSPRKDPRVVGAHHGSTYRA